MNDRCKTCRFFQPGAVDPVVGECRRYPPRIVVDGTIERWPRATAVDWCGEFERGATKGATAADSPPLPSGKATEFIRPSDYVKK